MKVLMVCLGNICRSPLAEGIMKAKLLENFEVDSAGTIAFHEGKNPDERSIKVAKQNGIDISQQKSRLITTRDLDDFDRIFCMDLKNYGEVVSMAKNETQRQKIALLLQEAGNNGEQIEVPDPYYGNLSDFEKVYKMLDEACEIVSKKLLNN